MFNNIGFINLLYLFICLAARGLDIFSTLLISPKLHLESNIIAKKLGWKVMIPLNVLICFLFSLSIEYTIVLTVISILVSANNFSRGIIAKGLGEERARDIYREAIRKVSLLFIIFSNMAYSAIYIGMGIAIVIFSKTNILIHIGIGFIGFGAAILIHFNISLIKNKLSSKKNKKIIIDTE